MQYYDLKTLLNFAVIDGTLQYLILDLYKSLKKDEDRTALLIYVSTALLNLGTLALSDMLARLVSDTLDHNRHEEDTTYTLAPSAEYLKRYSDYLVSEAKTKEEQSAIQKRASDIVNAQPKYSSKYVKTETFFYGTMVAFGFLVKRREGASIINSALYGLTQPTSIILDDAKSKS